MPDANGIAVAPARVFGFDFLQLRRFLLEAPRPTPTTADRAPATAPPNGASSLPPASQTAATAGSRRRTAPAVLSTVHEPLSPISAERGVVGAAYQHEESLERAAEKAGGGSGSGGGGAEAREIPGLRPGIKVNT